MIVEKEAYSSSVTVKLFTGTMDIRELRTSSKLTPLFWYDKGTKKFKLDDIRLRIQEGDVFSRKDVALYFYANTVLQIEFDNLEELLVGATKKKFDHWVEKVEYRREFKK